LIDRKRIFKTNDVLEAGEFHKPSEKKYRLKYAYNPDHISKNPIKPAPVSNVKLEEMEGSFEITFDGDADAYAIVSSDEKIKFKPISYGKDSKSGETYLPTYSVSEDDSKCCEVLRFQGTKNRIVLPKKFEIVSWENDVNQSSKELEHNQFTIFAIKAGNGKVIYSDGVEVTIE